MLLDRVKGSWDFFQQSRAIRNVTMTLPNDTPWLCHPYLRYYSAIIEVRGVLLLRGSICGLGGMDARATADLYDNDNNRIRFEAYRYHCFVHFNIKWRLALWYCVVSKLKVLSQSLDQKLYGLLLCAQSAPSCSRCIWGEPTNTRDCCHWWAGVSPAPYKFCVCVYSLFISQGSWLLGMQSDGKSSLLEVSIKELFEGKGFQSRALSELVLAG